MIGSEFIILITTAASIGFIHTIFGPDHYLPFIVMSKARGWSTFKTGIITFLCGLGHILGSIILGFIGITLGIAVSKLEFVESVRGEIAAWFFIIFGFTYFVWGLHRAIRNKAHRHTHAHDAGKQHSHLHRHIGGHTHPHGAGHKSLTPWVLFTIFVFGPCEPLIPILMYPAAKGSILTVGIVAFVFGFTTILTMLGVVLAFSLGLVKVPLMKLERYTHALAGLVIFLSGAAIKFLGL